jgi:transcriptional regulator with XRE-family HTH domain
MVRLGDRLAKARGKTGLSLRKVSDKLKKRDIDVSHSYLSHLENNRRKNPNLDLLRELADIYNVSVSYFVAPEKTLESLSSEEKAYLEDILKNDKMKALLREARGLTPNDLVRVIQIAKSWNEDSNNNNVE